MSMIQIVIGTALGFMVAQSALYGIRRLMGWLRRDESRGHSPSRGHSLISAFIKYAAPVGASAALIMLGVWGVGDYLAAKSVHAATASSAFDPSAPAPDSEVSAATGNLADAPVTPADDAPTAVSASNRDPYRDPDFKVHRRPHRAGSAMSLKETLLERSEAKARTDLLKEIQQHLRRSQYDCEAAERAAKYLKADLDVWGFAAWQAKYFPTEAYEGATLPQCSDIKSVIDSSGLDLKSTVAQGESPVGSGR
jgi:hypothetical protein